MTDGTTGIQVAPITEDDMSKVRDILQRALDAVVSMSKLSGEVEQLRLQVAQLTDDSERLRRSNMALDESLSIARTQRLELEAKLKDADTAKYTAQAERDDARAEADRLKRQVESLTMDLETSRKEHNQALSDFIKADDELSQVKAKIASIHSALGIPPVPAPEAMPTPPPPVGPVVQQPTEAAPTPTPEPQPEPVPLPDAASVDWDKPYRWNPERGTYENVA